MVFVFVKQKTAYEMRISDWSPDVCSSDLDHMVPTQPGRTEASAVSGGAEMIKALEENARAFGIDHYGMAHDPPGIVHVVAPELGMVVPGMTAVRSEERRVGKACVSTCRSRGSPYTCKKHTCRTNTS